MGGCENPSIGSSYWPLDPFILLPYKTKNVVIGENDVVALGLSIVASWPLSIVYPALIATQRLSRKVKCGARKFNQ